jgi:hypothetical protein
LEGLVDRLDSAIESFTEKLENVSVHVYLPYERPRRMDRDHLGGDFLRRRACLA